MCLNEQQIEAIHTVQGPCLVLAGAGSGKTTVIINKIIQLVHKYGYHSDEIFAVTFTNKAAQEMKFRTQLAVKNEIYSWKNLNILTFHALGMKIITQSLDLLGYKKDYTLFSYFDQIRLMKDIVSKSMRNNHYILKKIITYISFQKNKIINPEQSKKQAVSQEEKIFSEYYIKYNQFLKTYNVFDFDDLIYIAVNILEKYENIRNKWRNYVKYLLVDEYQDTNFSQYKLIQLLTGNVANFTLVGDDDQSIYSWRGASIDNILLLKHDYPNLKVIKMEHNYRSSKRILRAANVLISHNIHIFQKKLFSNLEYGTKIRVLQLQNEHKEAKKIVHDILLHKLQNNLYYHDYVILYRMNYQSQVFEKYLFQKKIPYFVHNKNKFFNQSEIRNLIYYLKFIINQDDNITFLKIINLPNRKIGIQTVKKIIQYAGLHQKSYFQTIQDSNFIKILHKNKSCILNQFVLWWKSIIIYFKHKPQKVLHKILHDIKYNQWIIKTNKNINQCIQNVRVFLDWIDDFFHQHSNKTLKINTYELFVQLINQLIISDVNIQNQNSNVKHAVQLMTIHASKGLEFQVVFIVGLEEGIIPSLHHTDLCNISEERRLIYVAITRAKKKLTLSFCNQRYSLGKSINIQPSRFLFELPKNDLIWENIIL